MGLTADQIDACTGIVPVSMCTVVGKECVRMAMFEIYNEEVYDLLNGRERIILRNNRSELVINAHEREVRTYEQFRSVVTDAIALRITKCTRMNAGSSRSHAVIRVCTDRASLVFVDLAGSERTKRTGVSNDTMKEAISINTGLLALGNVINALYNKKKFVPYRDSKLTRILKPILNDNTIVRMIACVSDSYQDANETMNTLEYANRAGCLRTVVKREPVVGREQGEVIRLREEIGRLRRENEWLRKELKDKTGRGICGCYEKERSTDGKTKREEQSTACTKASSAEVACSNKEESATDTMSSTSALNDRSVKTGINADVSVSTRHSPIGQGDENLKDGAIGGRNDTLLLTDTCMYPMASTPIRNKVTNTVLTPVRRNEDAKNVHTPTPIRKINFDLSKNLTLDVGQRKVRRIISHGGKSCIGDESVDVMDGTIPVRPIATEDVVHGKSFSSEAFADRPFPSKPVAPAVSILVKPVLNKPHPHGLITDKPPCNKITAKRTRQCISTTDTERTRITPLNAKRVRALNGLRRIRELAVHSSTVLSITYLNDGLYTISSDNTLRRTVTGRTVTLKRCLFLSLLARNEHSEVLYSTNDGLYFVDGPLIRRYDTGITSMCYQGTYVVTGHINGQVCVCDVRMGVLYEGVWHKGYVNAVRMHDGVIYTGSVDSTVCYAEMVHGAVDDIRAQCLLPAHSSPVNLILMHEGFLFSASKEGNIRKWKNHQLIKECKGTHSSFIRAGASNAEYLYTGCKDGVVKRWSAEMEERGNERVPCSVVCMDGTGDGVVVGGSDGKVYFLGE